MMNDIVEAMELPFPALLVKLREAAGHGSARSFFQSSGGRAFFGCTYKQYSNVEAGRSQPNALLVERAASALRLSHDPEQSRAYARAYLQSVVGREELVDFLAASLNPAARSSGAPLRQALKRHGDERTVPLSEEQSRAIRASAESLWCYAMLSNDRGRHEASTLARLIGASLPTVNKALAELVKTGIIARDPKSLYYCPKAGWFFQHPREELYRSPKALAQRERWLKMSRERGEVLGHDYILVRASEAGIRSYLPYLAQTVSGADVYSTTEKGPDTSLILIEATTRRVCPF